MEKYYNGKLYNTENMKLLAKKEPYNEIIKFYQANDGTYWIYRHEWSRVFIWTYDIANSFECLNENEFKNEILKELGMKKLQTLFKIELV
jgi:hypothetical protein